MKCLTTSFSCIQQKNMIIALGRGEYETMNMKTSEKVFNFSFTYHVVILLNEIIVQAEICKKEQHQVENENIWINIQDGVARAEKEILSTVYSRTHNNSQFKHRQFVWEMIKKSVSLTSSVSCCLYLACPQEQTRNIWKGDTREMFRYDRWISCSWFRWFVMKIKGIRFSQSLVSTIFLLSSLLQIGIFYTCTIFNS